MDTNLLKNKIFAKIIKIKFKFKIKKLPFHFNLKKTPCKNTNSKFEYFKIAKWPQEWIDKAINLTRNMYDSWYKPKQLPSAPKTPKTQPIKVSILC